MSRVWTLPWLMLSVPNHSCCSHVQPTHWDPHHLLVHLCLPKPVMPAQQLSSVYTFPWLMLSVPSRSRCSGEQPIRWAPQHLLVHLCLPKPQMPAQQLGNVCTFPWLMLSVPSRSRFPDHATHTLGSTAPAGAYACQNLRCLPCL